MRSLRVATIAASGIGTARELQTSGVTAIQSAGRPASDASAVARTEPSQGNCGSKTRAATNTSNAIASSPVARRFIASSRACRSASSGRDHCGVTGAGAGAGVGLVIEAKIKTPTWIQGTRHLACYAYVYGPFRTAGRRIEPAQGSGGALGGRRPVQEGNRLLEQFQQMRK